MSRGARKPLFVVTLPAHAAATAADYAARARAAGADLLELRGDLVPDLAAFSSPLPLLVAPRGAGSEFAARHRPAWVDLEADETIVVPSGARLIRSHHDHAKTPAADEIVRLAERLAVGADIVKIAVCARTYRDLATIEEARSRLDPKRPCALIAMGAHAWPSRLRAPAVDALVYSCLDPRDAAAPGQVPLAAFSRDTSGAPCAPTILGLLCAPGAASLSPLIHSALGERTGANLAYGLFATDDPDGVLAAAAALGVCGLSVTNPYKHWAFAQARRRSPLAERLGVVNTLVRDDDGWVGHQTDAVGFARGYAELRSATAVAVIGSGGVVPAVIDGIRTLGAGRITVFARARDRRRALAAAFAVDERPLSELPQSRVDAVVWCLPVDSDEILLPEPAGEAVAIDLRYGRPTGFLHRAAARGFAARDGLSMLLEQAIEQFRLWTGTTLDDGVRPFLRDVVARRSESAS